MPRKKDNVVKKLNNPDFCRLTLQLNSKTMKDLALRPITILFFVFVIFNLQAQYLSEDFEGGALPTDWANEYSSGSVNWQYANGGYSSCPPAAHGGNFNARFFTNNYNEDATILVTDTIDISGATNPELVFWHTQDAWGTDQDELRVLYKADPSDPWTLIPGAVWIGEIVSWTQETISLPNKSSSYCIGFEATSGYGYGVTLDDIIIQDGPACSNPSEPTASNESMTSANLGWIENGSATSWNIEWGENGFSIGSGTTIAGTSTNPHFLFGLTASTNYEFYVQSDCGAEQSAWIGPYAFQTTACDAADKCTYTITMGDKYSDGWNGASVEFIQDGISLGTYSLANGSATDTETIEICDSKTIELIWTAGSYPGECSFTLTDPFGIDIYSFGQDQAPSSGTFYTFSSNCYPNTETDILSYSIPEETGSAIIDDVNHTVDIEVVYSSDITSLVASFALSQGATAEIASVVQESGVTENDFTNTVVYNIIAQDGSTTQSWDITVTKASLSSETDILTYSFPEEVSAATINASNHTIDISVVWNADVINLTAGFSLTPGATAEINTVVQETGVTVNNFTNPVVYLVIAEDGIASQEWTVTVTVADPIDGTNCSHPIVISSLPYSATGLNTSTFDDVYSGSGPCTSVSILY